MTTRARQPRGIPTGGEFASTPRAESGSVLQPNECEVVYCIVNNILEKCKKIVYKNKNGVFHRDPSDGPAVTIYLEDGTLVEERFYVNGSYPLDGTNAHGLSYHDNGVLSSEVIYYPDDDGGVYSRMTVFRDDGTRSSVTYYNELEEVSRPVERGPADVTYHNNGEVETERYVVDGSDVNGLSGLTAQTFDEDGKLTFSRSLFDDGEKMTITNRYYTDQPSESEEVCRYWTGEKLEVRMYRGVGESRELVSETLFKDDVPHSTTGPALIYYENGEVSARYFYLNGTEMEEIDFRNSPLTWWEDDGDGSTPYGFW